MQLRCTGVGWGIISVQSETTSRANWCRGRAADCLALTEHAPTDLVKAMFADMAARWVRLAEIVHRWEGGDGKRPAESRDWLDTAHAAGLRSAQL